MIVNKYLPKNKYFPVFFYNAPTNIYISFIDIRTLIIAAAMIFIILTIINEKNITLETSQNEWVDNFIQDLSSTAIQLILLLTILFVIWGCMLCGVFMNKIIYTWFVKNRGIPLMAHDHDTVIENGKEFHMVDVSPPINLSDLVETAELDDIHN